MQQKTVVMQLFSKTAVFKLMKKILLLILVFLMLPNICFAVDTSYDVQSGSVIIEGKINAENVDGRGVSVLLKKRNAYISDPEFIGYANQIDVNSDGSYNLKFDFTKNIDDYELLIYNGDTKATDTVTVAKYTQNVFKEARVSFAENESTVTFKAALTNNRFASTFSCKAVIAGYDIFGKLVYINTSDTYEFNFDNVETVELKAEIPNEAQKVKGFVWGEFEKLIPLSEHAEKNDKIMAYSWSLPQEGADEVFPMFYIFDRKNQKRSEDTEGISYANMSDGEYKAAAEKMKAFMEMRPKEERVAICHLSKTIYDPENTGTGCFDNWFWWDDGINKVIDELNSLLCAYKEIDGPELHAIFWDFEAGCDSSNIVWRYIGVKPTYNDDGSVSDSGQLSSEELEARYQAVIDDERYLSDIRPSLEKLGFEFYEGGDHNELYYYFRRVAGHTKSYYIGQIFAEERKYSYLNKIYEKICEIYPDIFFSNYGDYNLIMADEPMENENSSWHIELPAISERLPSPVGTHGSPVLYGQMSDNLKIDGYAYGTTFAKTPFNGALAVLQKMQRTAAYSPEWKIMPWVGNRTWDYSDKIPYASTEYYSELILHLGLTGARGFLYFNNASASADWAKDDVLFSELMEELNSLIGVSGRKCLTAVPVSSNVRYMLSGMDVGNRNIWRITPDIYTPDGNGGYVTKESFLIDSVRPTFRIGNQVVKFPEGSKILNVANEKAGVGYWVETPEDTVVEEYIDESFSAPLPTDYVFAADFEYEKLKAQYEAGIGEEE